MKIKLDKGWKKLLKALNPVRNRKIVNKHMFQATILNGKVLVKKIQQTIKEGGYTPNAPLTIAIKNADKPLVGVETGAHLFGSITSKPIKRNIVFAGILRTERFYNIAVAIHEGVEISVTDKMRGLFLALWRASQGTLSVSDLSERGQELFSYMDKGWKPLKSSTTKIVIPERPFIDRTMDNPEIIKLLTNNWNSALKAAFKEARS